MLTVTRRDKAYIETEVVTLRDHFDTRLAALGEYFESRIKAMDEANRVLADAMRDRFAGVNEFRGVLTDQTASFPTRAELGPLFDKLSAEIVSNYNKLSADIDTLKQFQSEMKGKASQSSVNQATMFSIAALMFGVLSFLWNVFGK